MTKHFASFRYNRQPQGCHAVPGSISTIYLPPACLYRSIRLFFKRLLPHCWKYIKMYVVRNFRTTSRGLPSELMKCTTGNMTRSRRAPPQVDLHVFIVKMCRWCPTCPCPMWPAPSLTSICPCGEAALSTLPTKWLFKEPCSRWLDSSIFSENFIRKIYNQQ